MLTEEIISRKATDLDKVQFSTYERYLKEMHNKYESGTVIRSNKYGDLDGEVLSGELVLEIPASNKKISNIQEFIDFAKNKYDIRIKFGSVK